MTYRDDLAAAQARADALQRRVVELEAENAALVRVRDGAVTPARADLPKRRFARGAAVGTVIAGAGLGAASALVADPLVRVVLMLGAVGCLPLAMSFLILATRWIKAGPDEAVIVTGGKRGPRVIAPGHGSFVAPFLEEARALDLRPVEVRCAVYKLAFTAVVRIGRTDQDILRASERFLGAEHEIADVARPLVEAEGRRFLVEPGEREDAWAKTLEHGQAALEPLGLQLERVVPIDAESAR